MFVEELMVKSSIQVFMANPEHPKPQVFGSGCLVNYVYRLFFLSTSSSTRLLLLKSSASTWAYNWTPL
jgi:hypothetical protein